MKLIMTMMVRDEADIIEAMIDHHLQQGIDLIIVTDNGSVDGTTEILKSYEDKGVVDLRFDPVHRKQQSETVTKMARDAYAQYGADWVINADADEFWVAKQADLTVREAFDRIPTAYQSFLVPVVDMTGPPARSGTGLSRLVYRDNRSNSELRKVGLLGHSTPDAVHVGSDSVTISQGNHEVNLPSKGSPETEAQLEVLHLPWRSWEQFAQKVENAGRSYDSNPDLKPSPNHHGMRDYKRLQDGTLVGYYVARHPDQLELEKGLANGTFVMDDRIARQFLTERTDVLFTTEALEDLRQSVQVPLHWESRALDAEHELAATVAKFQQELARLVSELEIHHAECDERRDMLQAEINSYRQRFVVRSADKLGRMIRHR